MNAPDPAPRPSRKFGPKLLLGTAAAAALIGAFEGGKDKDGSAVVYADHLAGGLPTVCHGLTKHITATPIIVGQRWSAAKCLAEEQAAIIKIQLNLEKCFNYRPPQSVFDAATSFAWNNGVVAMCGTAAMRAWNVPDWPLGCVRLSHADSGKRVWTYVKDGKGGYTFVQGLANRRDVERRYCMGDIK